MRYRNLILLGVVLAALAGGGFWAWRARVEAKAVAAALPQRPDLRRYHVDLMARVAAAEEGVRQGRKAALAELQSLYQVNGYLAEADHCGQALMHLELSNPLWPHRLATIRAGYGELETAILLWERTVRQAPKFVPARIRLGDAYLKSNRDADAQRTYEAVLAQESANPYALVGLARLDVKAGNLTRARSRLEQAAEESRSAIGPDLLVTVYEQLGEEGRARALRARVKAAGTYYDPPDPWLDVMFDQDCFDIFQLCVAAGFAEHRGDKERARMLLERANGLEPKGGHVLLQLGMLCHRTRDMPSAQRYFEKATEVEPTMSDAWAQLINLYNEKGDRMASARALAAGLTHCPNSPGLHLERARRLAAGGQIDAAIAEYRLTYRLRPEEADPLIEIAQIYLKQERTAEAVAELNEALLSEPEHPTALMILAMHAVQAGDEAEAREWIRRCHLQLRVPRDALAEITSRYAQRFGRPYPAAAFTPAVPK